MHAFCLNKLDYPSRKDAARAAKDMRRWRHKSYARPYACKDCGRWHVGHG